MGEVLSSEEEEEKVGQKLVGKNYLELMIMITT
jgi:hypothetical protein